jgi:hypothetical protein
VPGSRRLIEGFINQLPCDAMPPDVHKTDVAASGMDCLRYLTLRPRVAPKPGFKVNDGNRSERNPLSLQAAVGSGFDLHFAILPFHLFRRTKPVTLTCMSGVRNGSASLKRQTTASV